MKCKKCNKEYDASAWICPSCGELTTPTKFTILLTVIAIPLIIYANLNKNNEHLTKDQALEKCKIKVQSSIGSKITIGDSDSEAYQAGKRTLKVCMKKYGY